MKGHFADLNNIVVKPESLEEELLIKSFIEMINSGKTFIMHGYTYSDGKIRAVNFGYHKEKIKKKE